MNRAVRSQLAVRAAAVMAVGLGAIGAVTLWALRGALDREMDASLMTVASVQAASLTDAPSGEMRFHEWELTPDEAASLSDLVRYAQVWQADGVSLLRSRFMTSDLPLDREHLARAGEGELVWTVVEWDGTPMRTLYYPLERHGALHQRHVLQVAGSLAARNEMLARVALFLGLLTALVAGVSFLGSSWLAGRAMRPVHEVMDQAEEIGGGSLDRRIHAYADHQEYRRLVEVLNTMLGRIQGAFEAQRRFTADAGHELRSPLTAMRGELELALRRERAPEEYRQVLASTLEEVIRLSRISEDLLVLARSDSGALEPRLESCDVAAVVARVAERLQGMADAGGVTLAIAAAEGVWGVADPGLLGQVAWNLLENALRFTPRGGRVQVTLSSGPDGVRLEVADTGRGFHDADEAFRRFYREDPARSHAYGAGGTGLGLAIVRAVAEAHGGSARAKNRPKGGARVIVDLPGQGGGA
ncbi:MAG: HAMP domain-containing protein [Gemmatimonadetes bacterium]|nr:HAMP domain-containing protein [Gemmatimonadota bacterium]